MPIIRLETDINVPREVCFDLARDMALHPQTVRGSKERAVAGRVRGLLGPGEWVTFEAMHFGVRQRLTARMTEFEAPVLFADEMTQGAFQSLTHRHEFSSLPNGGTRMTDTLEFVSPLGALGRLADHLFLVRHMRQFLEGRNRELKRIAESGAEGGAMSDYYINVHVRAENPAQVQSALTEIFGAHGFLPLSDEAAAVVVDDEDKLPEGEEWYGVLLSSHSGTGWVSVYVEDWQDSGVLARELSQRLEAPTLEIWVAEETHWGYNYFENGVILDRFADDPQQIAETPAEAAQLIGHAEAPATVLRIPVTDFDAMLRTAQTQAGEFAGPGVDGLAQAVGLSFEHVFIGYEAFFEDDPEDYAPSLERWSQWRHLAYKHPMGQETLSE